MKIFQCQNCSHPVYFENVVCEKCHSWLGYLADSNEMLALAPGKGPWLIDAQDGRPYAYCANHQHKVCNWMVPVDAPGELCRACSLNDTIPNLQDPENLRQWRELEEAKHRLVYSLLRLGLPVFNKDNAPKRGLAFDFLSDDDAEDQVMTGHDSGLVTINTNEADSVHREATRIAMNERYRTLIGHFRHEVGHYYWDLLVASNHKDLTGFRQLFGDERADYQEALKLHYQKGRSNDWMNTYISSYATSHPWEDWAETWAHYLHLLAIVETAYSFGMQLTPRIPNSAVLSMNARIDPYGEPDFRRIIDACVPLTFAVNSLNRVMGQEDLYPFVLNDAVREKLVFVHEVVRRGAGK